MRTILVSVLLATSAASLTAPAIAQPADREDRAKEREERRAERAETRRERSEARAARPEAGHARPEAHEDRAQRVRQLRAVREQNVESREQQVQHVDQVEVVQEQNSRRQLRDRRRANLNERGRPTLDQERAAREDTTVQSGEGRDLDQRRLGARERYAERFGQRRLTPPAGARPDRPAPPPQTATSHRGPTWSTTHWRRDGRYDWRRWRDRNRSHFRLGIYFDPFGWNYRRYGIGWRLWPSYYSSHYWLNDPWSYRLPYAPWPYKWVRYYDDAILVNTMTGRVVDVIYDFFW